MSELEYVLHDAKVATGELAFLRGICVVFKKPRQCPKYDKPPCGRSRLRFRGRLFLPTDLTDFTDVSAPAVLFRSSEGSEGPLISRIITDYQG